MNEQNPLEDISRQLDAIERREVEGITKRGDLLEQAKKLLGAKGGWVRWLKTRHAMPERTAQRYMKASRFAKEYATVADFSASRLTANALYLLTEDRFWKKAGLGENARRAATEEVLKAATKKGEKVGAALATQIIKKTIGKSEPPEPAQPVAPAEAPRSQLSTANKRYMAAVMELQDLFATKVGTQTCSPHHHDTSSKEIALRAEAKAGVVPVEIVRFVIDALNEVVRASTSEDAVVVNKPSTPQDQRCLFGAQPKKPAHIEAPSELVPDGPAWCP